MVVEPALEVVGVSKHYEDRQALDHLDLVVSRGRLHGLLGPNGAGKTTLIRVCLGLIRPDGGNVRLLGCNLRSTGGPLPDGVAGFVETPAFYPYLSARKNLLLLARLDGHRGFTPNRTDHALEQVGLAAQADIAVAGYSAGMRQRLGIAAALLRSPRLLFLDEPTSSLDPAGAHNVRALARHLANEGTAVVLSSHDLAEVEELCSEITVINRGRVVFSGTVDQLRARAPAAVHAMHTSNNRLAYGLASRQPGVKVANTADGGLQVSAGTEALDAYVIALGCTGIAVRVLEHRPRSLESLFLELTGLNAREVPAPEFCDIAPVIS
jgi:ABC-2 type transport system ATP-binding protein